LKALFDAATDRAALRLALDAQFAQSLPSVVFEDVADRVWEREWLKDFRPMRFGRRLWICPAGMRPDATDTDSAQPPVFIDLDPGLAFGTGTHPTTALCLEWLDAAELAGSTVIDFGCGSGVLAIAALKLGAKQAIAVDIDPQAIVATIANAERNGVSDRLVAATVEEASLSPADIVLANILAEPLQQLAAQLADLVRKPGHIVLSGLLISQAQRLATLYGTWFDMATVSTREDWARLAGTRR
jgi:ribosomal protein L11 methyltransferase